ncbi:MAG: ATP-dependent helicase C-terminal domain-containing protein, partial [Desulfuromonadaceae bacterium]|nr:ATP-dependent helicase C-terminal domain-containing protein [Desulfuromonadaceae bacterium]
GRTAPGLCYRLFSEHTLQGMTPHTPPEISVTDLSQLLLELAAWGVIDPLQLSWLDPPDPLFLNSARNLLMELELLDSGGRITSDGAEVVKMPLHPRLGRMLLCSEELGCTALGCHIAALLSERDIIRTRGSRIKQVSTSDIADRLNLLKCDDSTLKNDSDVDFSAVKNVRRVILQLGRCMLSQNIKSDFDHDDRRIPGLLLSAYPDRVAKRRSSNSSAYLLATGRGARISDRSAVKNPEFIVALALDAGQQADAIIHLAAEIPESVVREKSSKCISIETSVVWDDGEGRVISRRSELLGSITLAEYTVVPSPVEAVGVVINAVRASGLSLLTISAAVRQFQGRTKVFKKAFPEKEFPDFSNAALINKLEDWLLPHLDGVNSAKKISQLNIVEILMQRLEYRQKRDLDEFAPEFVTVPSGSRIRIDYSGEVPVLAVKLQELFGLAEGPAICDRRVKLLLHLLSPAGRPIQITNDLCGFWNGSYQQVKKELKGRYPKHPWPDDPWSAMPTRRVKPKNIQA